MKSVNATPSPARRLLNVWGVCPPFAVRAEEVTLTTRDSVRLAASYLPGPALARPAAAVPGVVLLHGFGAHRRKPPYRLLAERLAADCAVLVPDLRGHGRSGGRSSLGDHEIHDARAAVAWLRRRGHRWVAIIGASMGGTAALRAAGTPPSGLVDAVCAISAPAVWSRRDAALPAVRGLVRAATNGWYRAALGSAMRIRIAAWHPHHDPAAPIDVVAAIAPVPLLLIHAADDHYFPVTQAEALAAAAGPGTVLWREPAGSGHAEDLFAPAFADRLSTAVANVYTTGSWPAR